LNHLGDKKWIATTLYVLAKRVVFTDPRSEQRVEVISGQRVFDIPLKLAVTDTRKAIQELNSRGSDAAGKVVHGKFTLQNEPVFLGTRIPVSTIKRYLEAGFSNQKIIEEFPDLKIEDIEEARVYKENSSAA